MIFQLSCDAYLDIIEALAFHQRYKDTQSLRDELKKQFTMQLVGVKDDNHKELQVRSSSSAEQL